MNIPSERRVQISPEVLFQEVSGETVLLDLKSESYFGLDVVGTRMWGLLQSGSTLGEVVEALLSEYEVDRETLESDVGKLLEDLEQAGLIQYVVET